MFCSVSRLLAWEGPCTASSQAQWTTVLLPPRWLRQCLWRSWRRLYSEGQHEAPYCHATPMKKITPKRSERGDWWRISWPLLAGRIAPALAANLKTVILSQELYVHRSTTRRWYYTLNCSALSSTLRYRFGTVVSNEPGEHSLSPGLVIHGVNLPSCMALIDGLAEIKSIFSLVWSSLRSRKFAFMLSIYI